MVDQLGSHSQDWDTEKEKTKQNFSMSATDLIISADPLMWIWEDIRATCSGYSRLKVFNTVVNTNYFKELKYIFFSYEN